MASVKLKSITKKFGDITAIDNMSIDVKDGEFFILLGPTGAGKTTTLRLIAGLENCDEGEIFIGEEKANDITPADRDTAFIFQYYSLYPNLTVRQNLEFPLKSPIRQTDPDRIKEIVGKTAKILRIDHLLDRRSDKLSGGEMQRVSIGRAIVREPKVFLMDEPLSNLDAKLREEMRAELKRLQVDLGSTIFFVTHDQIEAMTMSDRIAVLNKGKILQIGTPDDIYNDPQNIFVATFVGSPIINQFEAEIESGKCIIEKGLMECDLSENQKKSLYKYNKKKIAVAIRPEDVKLEREGSSSGKELFSGEVSVIAKMGMEDIVSIKSGQNIFKALTPPTFMAKVGENIKAEFDKEKVYLFDIETGQRIV